MRNLYHIPVTQEHLDAGQSATRQSRGGNVAMIPPPRGAGVVQGCPGRSPR